MVYPLGIDWISHHDYVSQHSRHTGFILSPSTSLHSLAFRKFFVFSWPILPALYSCFRGHIWGHKNAVYTLLPLKICAIQLFHPALYEKMVIKFITLTNRKKALIVRRAKTPPLHPLNFMFRKCNGLGCILQNCNLLTTGKITKRLNRKLVPQNEYHRQNFDFSATIFIWFLYLLKLLRR